MLSQAMGAFSIKLGNIAFFFNCKTMGQTSDIIMASAWKLSVKLVGELDRAW